VTEGILTLRDGRSVGYADYGVPEHTAVLWCHGGPGSRLEPQGGAPAASAAGFRLVGIDRPGYGNSTPQPRRTIGGWVRDGLAVADRLGIERFLAVGVSTGGAYALALAAAAPRRVLGVVAACALTDMRWAEGKSMMVRDGIEDIWAARDRADALRIATDLFGADGTKMLTQVGATALPPSDVAFLSDPAAISGFLAALPAMFAHGPQGYADDRLADGPGWGSFDVSAVRCPVTVLHGGSDTIVPVAHAHHTAEIVPGAKLRVVDELGHFSILGAVPAALAELPRR
jgi:pimeloyl-ACP methyl ester carboxylesterase